MLGRRVAVAGLLALAATLSSQPVAEAAPKALTALPGCAAPGAKLSLSGSGLQAVRSVQIGGKPARITSRSSTRLRLRVPAKAKPGFGQLRARWQQAGRRGVVSARFRVGCGDALSVSASGPTARQRIAASGGSVQLRGSGGAPRAELALPAGALSGATEISMRRAVVHGLPFSGGVLGAVDFAPDGLTFAAPAKLSFTLPSKPRGKIVGFTFDGSGANWQAVPATVRGRTVTLAVDHFSGAGIAEGAAADFAAGLAPIINGLGTLSLQAMRNLRLQMQGWNTLFPGFCAGAGKAVCEAVEAKILSSANTAVALACPAPPAPLPEVAPEPITRLVGIAGEVSAGPAQSFPPAFECSDRIFTEMVKVRGEAAVANPRAPNLKFLAALMGNGELLGLGPKHDQAIQGYLQAALDKLLAEITALCSPPANEQAAGLTLVAETLEMTYGAEQLFPGLEAKLNALVIPCGGAISITPAAPKVKVGEQLQLAAKISGLPDQSVTWNAVGGFPLGASISQTGLFSAGPTPGEVEVTATSNRLLTLEATTTVTIVEDALPPADPDIPQVLVGCIVTRNPLSNVVAGFNLAVSVRGRGRAWTAVSTGTSANVNFRVNRTSRGQTSLSAFIGTIDPPGTYVLGATFTNEFGDTVSDQVTGIRPEGGGAECAGG